MFLGARADGESAWAVCGPANRPGHRDGRARHRAGHAAPSGAAWGPAPDAGADKGYHSQAFVRDLRQRGIRPHLARVRGRRTPGLDGRTTRHAGYALSQRIRKRVEEII